MRPPVLTPRTRVVMLALLLALPPTMLVADDFRVQPYLQNPTSDGVTIRWHSESAVAGTIEINGRKYSSSPALAAELDYQASESQEGRHAGVPYLHSVRVADLQADTAYDYSVTNGATTLNGSFRTPLASAAAAGIAAGKGVRLFVYGDAETEPESVTKKAEWTESLAAGSVRPDWVQNKYVATQTVGYTQNLAVMQARAAEARADGRATVAAVVGDLVESGGEQRDWDEFWRHNAGSRGTFASDVAILPVFGNHENYGGPAALGGYAPAAAQAAAAKYRTYFDVPDNGQSHVPIAPGTYADHTGRYYRTDFGPVTLITIDASNGGTQGSADDTNFHLDNSANPQTPDYVPGSNQYQWLQAQLAAAQSAHQIVFVQYHHAAYSSGIHGQAAGVGTEQDNQSGRPLRLLTPLLSDYGVSAVFSGHDEMYEHAIVEDIHFYDVGIGGDGLRGATYGTPDYAREFLAHTDALEVWDDDVLLSGGKHYGHLEIDVIMNDTGVWDVTITPAYVFPLLSPDHPGEILGWERRTYDDAVKFTAVPEPGTAVLGLTGLAAGIVICCCRRRKGSSARA
ncbi:MAG: metallophosphoesterase [Pirellulaceae bacterium]